ncbi:MAG: oligosaccharide flippase family protein [Phycisphaeraceae bacterium]|nr:oligosaccharide flippase family protein [Phycisphaerales bacterium]MCB9861005.1 oligosaccharide flippase family protein [Phycisphaeraceae bacterium]
MSSRSKILKGAAVLSIGQIGAQAASFARNLIVARLLTKGDYGIAATFALTMSAAELMSDMAVDRLLVQDRDGNDPDMQATAQFIQFVRGLCSGMVLFVVAGFIAQLFQQPQTTWAYRWLALVPVMRGLMHLDFRRVQREMRYWPSVVTDTLPQILTALAAWPIVKITGSYAAMIWLILGQTASMLVLSHVLAKRRFSLGWTRQYGMRAIRFGWPLMLNGILLFAALQGDKVIVGANYSEEELADYYIAFTVALLPSLVLTKVLGSALLPWLSQAQSDVTLLRSRSALAMQSVSAVSLGVTCILVLAGSSLITICYGTKYANAGVYTAIFGAMTGIRLMRGSPTLVALATAKTMIPLYTNIARSLALIPVAYFALKHADLRWLAWAGLGGEAVSFLLCSLLCSHQCNVPRRTFLAPFALVTATCLCAYAASRTVLSQSLSHSDLLTMLVQIAAVTLASFGCTLAFAALFPQIRSHLGSVYSSLRHRMRIGHTVSRS